MKKHIAMILAVAALASSLAACAKSAPAETTAPETTTVVTEAPETTEAETTEAATTEAATEAAPALEDGVYLADFNTDSSMFHANETMNGKGTLTVKNGQMTIHVSLASTSILNLYPGLAEDAQKDRAVLLEHTEDEVTYPDGLKETVYGFDIPVPALDQEFDLALIGKKGKWYDHKVSVSNPEPKSTPVSELADGIYEVNATLEGGTGKTTLLTPSELTVADGKGTARIQFSSSKYDYMIVNGEKYLPLTTEGGSLFEIPVEVLDREIDVAADTTAMSTPHEIKYAITFDSATVVAK